MMRRLALAALLALVPRLAGAALSPLTQWEIRTAGSTTSGGGFKAGATGTDLSQYDNKNAAGCSSCQSATENISTTDAVTAGTTTVTSATANFQASIVGNIIYLQGGTGSVAADWYEVTARGSATSITVDRSTGLTAGTGVTLNIGGAISTLSVVETEAVAGNTIHVKQGTYGETLTLTVSGGNGTPRHWIGYASTRGDDPLGSTRPFIDAASTRASCLVIGNIVGNTFTSFRMGGGTSHNITVTNGTLAFRNVSSTLSAADGLNIAGGPPGYVINSEFASNTGDGIDSSNQNPVFDLIGSSLHDNTGSGWTGTGTPTSTIKHSVVESNAATGVTLNLKSITNSTFWGNTGASSDGYSPRNAVDTGITIVLGNIFEANGRYGINRAATTNRSVVSDYNSFSTNGTDATQNVTLGDNDTAIAASFTNAAGGDFSIGTALKALGFPAGILGTSSTSYVDIGAVQRQEAAAGGGFPIFGGSIIR